MNNRITAVFDAWITRMHDKLKQRIIANGIFDEDAFQETYLAMRDIVAPGDDERVFDSLFAKTYKYMLSREFNRESRYAHPDPLFFDFLRTEAVIPGEEQEQEKTPTIEVTAKQVDDYVKWHFVVGDYVIFRLKFFDGMSWQGLIDYTGHSSATIARKINGIKEQVKRHFTPPHAVLRHN